MLICYKHFFSSQEFKYISGIYLSINLFIKFFLHIKYRRNFTCLVGGDNQRTKLLVDP